jgi:NAD(P)-dependent dehydrogenase (short-subunit alcohol dehydrogenase family)
MTPVPASLLPLDYKALVVGGSGAIGTAFVAHFQRDPRCAQVHSLSRSTHPGFDLQNADSIAQQVQALGSAGPFHAVIDATGALSIDGHGPEKSLAALNSERLLRALHINAVGPALLLQHIAPLLAGGPAIYAKLSARVGSISDNHKGGWYGYRAAKAALNMLLQTAAIELQRRNPQLRVVALQPGTVRSELSKPFAAGVPVLLEPSDSVAGMMQALLQLQPKQGAHFVDYQGQSMAW